VKLYSIQYLRGVAALLIVAFHLFVQLNRLGYASQPPYVLNVGVDIFFVISGFVIWYTTFQKNIGVVEFLKLRIIRIVPLYWLITSFYLAVLLVRPNWMRTAQFELYHIIASYLFIPAADPVLPNLMWPVIVQGWTLNYEMFFYLLFGFVLALVVRARAGSIIAMLICIASLHGFVHPPNSIIGFYTSSIILEFAFGVILGYVYTNGVLVPRLHSSLILCAGIIVLVFEITRAAPDLLRVIKFGAPAFLVVAGAVFYERADKVIRVSLLELLGDASYSIYLSHGAILSALAQLWLACRLPPTSEPIYFVIFSLGAITIAISFGIGLYHFVERPLLRKLSIRFKRRDQVTAINVA
jgi:exopolysaccharide production protein ExoZ